jgi:hypothetical protein
MGVGLGILLLLIYAPLLILSMIGLVVFYHRYQTNRIGAKRAIVVLLAMLYSLVIIIPLFLEGMKFEVLLILISLGFFVQIASWIMIFLPPRQDEVS